MCQIMVEDYLSILGLFCCICRSLIPGFSIEEIVLACASAQPGKSLRHVHVGHPEAVQSSAARRLDVDQAG